MAEFNEETVKYLCRLSRFEISEEEIAPLFRSLKQILDHFDELGQVDLSDLSPYSHVDEQGVGSLREDEVRDELPRELFLANSSSNMGGMIKIPPVLKQP